ncbi:MAG: toll/interleukin-1 receptor domain-containing protein [Saccharofermentans sp.]|nr:toll/interleukin-1 receptor domain-containing protein [Saccharofermentans sp.]
MSNNEKYDAFISYRHCLPDSEIALRLQKKLESFRLPKDIAEKTGKSKLKSVFLDETELSVADDLSVEINAALLNSDYLIAICSPEYLKSKWCMREIQTFLDFNDRKNILLVLADGEPENAFPEILLYEDIYSSDAYGKVTKSKVYKEPLAAIFICTERVFFFWV